MSCLRAYAPSGIRTHDHLITSREHEPLHHSAPTRVSCQCEQLPWDFFYYCVFETSPWPAAHLDTPSPRSLVRKIHTYIHQLLCLKSHICSDYCSGHHWQRADLTGMLWNLVGSGKRMGKGRVNVRINGRLRVRFNDSACYRSYRQGEIYMVQSRNVTRHSQNVQLRRNKNLQTILVLIFNLTYSYLYESIIMNPIAALFYIFILTWKGKP